MHRAMHVGHMVCRPRSGPKGGGENKTVVTTEARETGRVVRPRDKRGPDIVRPRIQSYCGQCGGVGRIDRASCNLSVFSLPTIYAGTHTGTSTDTNTLIYAHTHSLTHTLTHLHTHARTHARTHTHKHARTHTYM